MSFDLRTAAVELVARTTSAQGLPEQLDDPVTLEQIARIVRTVDRLRGRP